MLVTYEKAMSIIDKSVITLPSYKGCVIEFNAKLLGDKKVPTGMLKCMIGDKRSGVGIKIDDDFDESFPLAMEALKRSINKRLNERGLTKCK